MHLHMHVHVHVHTHTHYYNHPSYESCCRCCPRQISQWKYSKAPELVKEQCIHVLLPGTTECYNSRSPLVNVLNPYPRSTSDAAWPTHTKPSGKRQWQRAWESIEAQLVELMLLTREARSPRWQRLQPCVLETATMCGRGSNLAWQRLQADLAVGYQPSSPRPTFRTLATLATLTTLTTLTPWPSAGYPARRPSAQAQGAGLQADLLPAA